MFLLKLEEELNINNNDVVQIGFLELRHFHGRFKCLFKIHPHILVEDIHIFTRCILIYLGYVDNYVHNAAKNGKLDINIIKDFCTVISDIPSIENINNHYIQQIFEYIYKRVTDPSTEVVFAKELLRNLNNVLQYSNKKLHDLISIRKILVKELIDTLYVCGDYGYQVNIIQVVFSMCSSRHILNEFAQDLFPESKTLDAFLDIRSDDFNSTIRIFLKQINSKFKNVLSLKCEYVVIDETYVFIAQEQPEVWVHFNKGTNLISIMCDRGYLNLKRPNEKLSDTTIPSLNIQVEEVTDVIISGLTDVNVPISQGLVLQLGLKKLHPEIAARDVKIVLVKCPELAYFITHVLPVIFMENTKILRMPSSTQQSSIANCNKENTSGLQFRCSFGIRRPFIDVTNKKPTTKFSMSKSIRPRSKITPESLIPYTEYIDRKISIAIPKESATKVSIKSNKDESNNRIQNERSSSSESNYLSLSPVDYVDAALDEKNIKNSIVNCDLTHCDKNSKDSTNKSQYKIHNIYEENKVQSKESNKTEFEHNKINSLVNKTPSPSLHSPKVPATLTKISPKFASQRKLNSVIEKLSINLSPTSSKTGSDLNVSNDILSPEYFSAPEMIDTHIKFNEPHTKTPELTSETVKNTSVETSLKDSEGNSSTSTVLLNLTVIDYIDLTKDIIDVEQDSVHESEKNSKQKDVEQPSENQNKTENAESRYNSMSKTKSANDLNLSEIQNSKKTSNSQKFSEKDNELIHESDKKCHHTKEVPHNIKHNSNEQGKVHNNTNYNHSIVGRSLENSKEDAKLQMADEDFLPSKTIPLEKHSKHKKNKDVNLNDSDCVMLVDSPEISQIDLSTCKNENIKVLNNCMAIDPIICGGNYLKPNESAESNSNQSTINISSNSVIHGNKEINENTIVENLNNTNNLFAQQKNSLNMNSSGSSNGQGFESMCRENTALEKLSKRLESDDTYFDNLSAHEVVQLDNSQQVNLNNSHTTLTQELIYQEDVVNVPNNKKDESLKELVVIQTIDDNQKTTKNNIDVTTKLKHAKSKKKASKTMTDDDELSLSNQLSTSTGRKTMNYKYNKNDTVENVARWCIDRSKMGNDAIRGKPIICLKRIKNPEDDQNFLQLKQDDISVKTGNINRSTETDVEQPVTSDSKKRCQENTAEKALTSCDNINEATPTDLNIFEPLKQIMHGDVALHNKPTYDVKTEKIISHSKSRNNIVAKRKSEKESTLQPVKKRKTYKPLAEGKKLRRKRKLYHPGSYLKYFADTDEEVDESSIKNAPEKDGPQYDTKFPKSTTNTTNKKKLSKRSKKEHNKPVNSIIFEAKKSDYMQHTTQIVNNSDLSVSPLHEVQVEIIKNSKFAAPDEKLYIDKNKFCNNEDKSTQTNYEEDVKPQVYLDVEKKLEEMFREEPSQNVNENFSASEETKNSFDSLMNSIVEQINFNKAPPVILSSSKKYQSYKKNLKGNSKKLYLQKKNTTKNYKCLYNDDESGIAITNKNKKGNVFKTTPIAENNYTKTEKQSMLLCSPEQNSNEFSPFPDLNVEKEEIEKTMDACLTDSDSTNHEEKIKSTKPKIVIHSNILLKNPSKNGAKNKCKITNYKPLSAVPTVTDQKENENTAHIFDKNQMTSFTDLLTQENISSPCTNSISDISYSNNITQQVSSIENEITLQSAVQSNPINEQIFSWIATGIPENSSEALKNISEFTLRACAEVVKVNLEALRGGIQPSMQNLYENLMKIDHVLSKYFNTN